MKTYVIKRAVEDSRNTVAKVTVKCVEGGIVKSVKPFLYHSPTGLNFGYSGSGCADLALTILVHYLDEQPNQPELRSGDFKAWKLHQKFKIRFVAPQKGLTFAITGEEINKFMEDYGVRKN